MTMHIMKLAFLFVFSTLSQTKAAVDVSLISEAQFDQLFSSRYTAESCKQGAVKLSYANFVAATQRFPLFATESKYEQINKREIAAFLGQISQETSGWWTGQPYTWGLCFVEEVNPPSLYADYTNTKYPPVQGVSYHGRGAMQISWSYNYGALSEFLFNDKFVLLNEPQVLVEDGILAFEASLWFWMTSQDPKPSAHDVMIGKVTECSNQPQSHLNGFGLITNIINGGLECGPQKAKLNLPGQKVFNRVAYYIRYCEILGISPGENLYCDTMQPYNQPISCKQEIRLDFELMDPVNTVTQTQYPSPIPVLEPPLITSRCGMSWADANQCHKIPCPSGTNTVCSNRESCYTNLNVHCYVGVPSNPKQIPVNPNIEQPLHPIIFRCGKTWGDANQCHKTPCPSKTNVECQNGETCFAGIDPGLAAIADCNDGRLDSITTSEIVELPLITSRCGSSWSDANQCNKTPCPSSTDAVCTNGETCYENLNVDCYKSINKTVEKPTTRLSPFSKVMDLEPPLIVSRCGDSWTDANHCNKIPCPSGTDSVCPNGQSCYTDLNVHCYVSSPSNPTQVPIEPMIDQPVPLQPVIFRCGTSWTDANQCHKTPCPSTTNSECQNDETCYAGIDPGLASVADCNGPVNEVDIDFTPLPNVNSNINNTITSTPIDSHADSDDCYSISHISDTWCKHVACSPAYSKFCSSS